MPKIRSGGRTDSGSPRSRTKGFRPLGPLADEALKRGKRSYNLWYLYGPKAGGDLIASSDAQAMDIWWRELDPSVRQYSLACPVPKSKVDSLPDISFTATVRLSDETTQLRDVRSDDLDLSGMHVDTESRPVRGNLAQGRRPYVRVDDVMYTNQMLANCPSLIGRPVTVHIDSNDMRHVKAFLPDGQPLGVLMAQSGWSRIRHSRQMRKLINRLRKTRQLIRSPGEDWVEAYLHTRTSEAAKAAVARPDKVSKEATQVADIAHRSGLNIPVVPDPADGSVTAIKAPKATTGTTPSAQHRTILPAFLQRPVRRAIL